MSLPERPPERPPQRQYERQSQRPPERRSQRPPERPPERQSERRSERPTGSEPPGPPVGLPGDRRAGATGSPPNRSAEGLITDIARVQHGVVTRRQLIGAGVTRRQVEGRLKSGWLRPLHRGVYLVGPLLPARAKAMAAALACGPGSVVSHRSAAWLWELRPRPPASWPVHVTVPGRDRGRRAGVRPHRVARLGEDEATRIDGIPVTTAARTLLDLASSGGGRALEQAVAEAERRGLIRRQDLETLIARYPARRGAPVLRALLRDGGRPALTRSEAENRFLALIRKARLPVPEVNALFAGFEVDFLWRSEGIGVEVDGFAYHASRHRFESDRRRDAQLAAEGLQVIRVTWRQIVGEPEAMLVRLARMMGARARGGRA